MPRLIPPVGEARDDYEIFAGLAERLGVGEAFTEGLSADEWIPRLYAEYRARRDGRGRGARSRHPAREELGKAADPDDGPNRTYFAPFREDPEAHPLGTPSGRIEIFSETIDGFGYDDCPGHPVWLPPSEWLGAATASAPLHLVSPQPGDKLHSQLESALADVEGARPETLVIHPRTPRRAVSPTAISCGCSTRAGPAGRGRGVRQRQAPGVVALPTGAWFGDPGAISIPTAIPNVLTMDVGTSRLGQGCSAHTALVEVALLSDAAE
jgi:biotin/methionine sulfoxide reductase